MPTAIAAFAHPDDIEFFGAGTLHLLSKAGWDCYYFCLCNGSGGSTTANPQQTILIRSQEGRSAAKILEANYCPPISDDLVLMYDTRTLAKVSAVFRDIAPDVVLTHSPQDYMEDHTNTSRLVSTAAFALRVPNFGTEPPRQAPMNDVAIYHAMPHGFRDQVRNPVRAASFVDTSTVYEKKLEALTAHASQNNWLEKTQGKDSYLETCSTMSRKMGEMSGRFSHAEGWRRHLHLGYSAEDDDPLTAALKERYWIDPEHPANQPV